IVDVRYNGGGFIPDRMIELLTRPTLNFWARRGLEPISTPGFANAGPKVCLINGQSGSGGDAFPYYFRELKAGPLIGTRTWGGLIGLSGNPSAPRRRHDHDAGVSLLREVGGVGSGGHRRRARHR